MNCTTAVLLITTRFAANMYSLLKTINGKKYRRSRCFLAHEDPEMLVSLAHRVYDNKSDKFIKYWFNAEDDDPRHPDFP